MTQLQDECKGLAAKGHVIVIGLCASAQGARRGKKPEPEQQENRGFRISRLKTMTMLYCFIVGAENNASVQVSFTI